MNANRGIRILITLAGLFAVGLLAAQSVATTDVGGLSPSSVFDVPTPPPERPNTTEPGDRPPVPVDFPDQPPLVPHGLAEWLPITQDDNQCLDCHAVEEKVEGEATPLPTSHYVDLRNAPDVVREEVAGARYTCVSCHVAPGDVEPLMENRFSEGN